MSTKIAAKGVIVKYAATATPTNILEGVKEVSLSLGDRPMIDSTTHDSTNTKEHIPNPLRETLEISIKLAHDPAYAGHEAIRAAHAAGTKHFIALVLPDAGAAQWEAGGYYTKFSPPAYGLDGTLEVDIVFKAIGVETYTQ